jgi:DNA-directed RNA polymerase subunit N (RpoN/RPB10)
MSETFFYSVIHDTCSCRQLNGDLKNIGKLYRIFYKRVNDGDRAVDVLSSMYDGDNKKGLFRMCCRARFLSIPIVPMIDRSKDRIYDDRKSDIIRKNTEKIQAGYQPLEFPILDGTRSLKVVPPTVKIEGTLPGDF